MERSKLSSPVLFLVFNRPNKTKESFDAIRAAKPTKLYVAADAPRANRSDDLINCEKVREIVRQVDWECDVKYLFQEHNLGCAAAGMAAWDWIFTQEEEMIFVEDDGVPSVSFFYYCQELLEKYRYDSRIAYIGGVNYGLTYGEATYFFSRFGCGTYGSATWKRVYSLYEKKMQTYPGLRNKSSFMRRFTSLFDYLVYRQMYDKYVREGGNTYDLQMTYLVRKYDMYNIIPNVNLVKNIGFDTDGTNTNVVSTDPVAIKYGNKRAYEINELRHPQKVQISKEFERRYFKTRVLHDENSIKVAFYKFIYPRARFVLKPMINLLKKVLR